jgi:beta-N-acetylhexosaminidase
MKRALSLLLPFASFLSYGQSSSWADSVLNTLTVKEKIGQLFMLPVSTYATPQEIMAYQAIIKKYKPGSLYIIKGSAKSHIRVVNKLQQASPLPLLVGLNAEWGLAQTLDSTFSFPPPIVVGANTSDELIRNMGHHIGKQMRYVGAHINFAPHADIHVPLESTVTYRYYGSNKNRVANQMIAFMDGLTDANVLAVAKHLPGITPGMPSKDISNHFKSGPDTTSFYPYQKLIEHGVSGLLTSHLHFGTLEDNQIIPAPLSQIFISDILKGAKGFKGLAFADIPYLKTIVRKRKGEAEKTAFQVGHDVLIAPHLKKSLSKISKLVKRDKKLMEQLNVSVKKILDAKYQAGLAKERLVKPVNLEKKLFATKAKSIDFEIREGAVTLLSNTSGLIPIQILDNRQFKLVVIGHNLPAFENMLNRYAPFEKFVIQKLSDTLKIESELQNAISIIVTTQIQGYSSWVKKVSNKHSVAVCYFGNVNWLRDLTDVPVLLAGYDENATGGAVAELIFGAIPARGSLPVTIGDTYQEGTKNSITPVERLSYSTPEMADMESLTLSKIDAIAQEALAIQAAPGARIMVARKGKIVYDKSFGWQSSDKKIPVTENTIYDLASVTKVTATLQAAMFMHERGLIDINKKISVYLPEFKETNKKDIIIKDILTHQAGLWPYFPWHVDLVKDSTLLQYYFSKNKSEDYPFPVSENLFSHKSMRDSMWSWILKSKLMEKKDRTPYETRYSDLGLYITQRLVEQLLNQPLEDFVAQNFYEPMGAPTAGFHPLERFPATTIAPTENDQAFRKSLLTGYVHDPGAAMYGGVAGHAGLFSNAIDLLKMGQMWLRKGSYGGTQYFKPETIELFSMKQFDNSTRGLGWAKATDPTSPSSGYMSPQAFGHTGFTGTCIWVDPEFDLVFVFLSNRVNPEVSSKLLTARIRQRIQDVVYQSIFNFSATHLVESSEKSNNFRN